MCTFKERIHAYAAISTVFSWADQMFLCHAQLEKVQTSLYTQSRGIENAGQRLNIIVITKRVKKESTKKSAAKKILIR